MTKEMILVMTSLSKDDFELILKRIAHKSFFIVDHFAITLTVAECVAIRDVIGTGNYGLYRLNQLIEALSPMLKGILIPPNIRNALSSLEKKYYA